MMGRKEEEGGGTKREGEGEKEGFRTRRQEGKRQKEGRKTGCYLWPPVPVGTSTIRSQPKGSENIAKKRRDGKSQSLL